MQNFENKYSATWYGQILKFSKKYGKIGGCIQNFTLGVSNIGQILTSEVSVFNTTVTVTRVVSGHLDGAKMVSCENFLL